MIDIPALQAEIRTRRDAVRPTPRQLECAQLVADGHHDADVAEQLSMSPKTAKTHITTLMRRTGTHTRTAAVVVCLRHGWIH